MRARSTTLLLACTVATLPGCLTRMLWAEDARSAPQARADTECRVHSVRGDFLHARRDTGPADPATTAAAAGAAAANTGPRETPPARTGGMIEVSFSVQREKSTSVDVMDFTPEKPGRLRLFPPAAEENWFALPGASLFQPGLWEFRAFRGSYFERASASVPMTFVGKLDPARVGSLRKASAAPAEWTRLQPLPALPHDGSAGDLLERSLKSFADRDWIRLISGETLFTERDAVPLAWLDDQGRVVTAEEMRRRLSDARLRPTAPEELAKYTLLGRLQGNWGEDLYVRVPVPVLVQGSKLELKRVGGSIVWQRRQVWMGLMDDRPGPAPDLAPEVESDAVAGLPALNRPANSIPLIRNRFVYSYAQEHGDSSVLGTLFKYLLTPPALLLDFVAETSVFYADVVRWLASDTNRDYQGPIAPDKNK